MSAYRAADAPVLRQRRAEVEAEQELLEPELPALRDVHAARIARIVSGATGFVGAFFVCIFSIGDDRILPTAALLLSVAAMFATWAITRIALGLVPAKRIAPKTSPLELTGHLATDLAAIDARAPWSEVEQKLHRLESASTALPLGALSLILPLTIHYPFAVVLFDSDTHDYSKWIRMSLVIVGFAHLTLMGLAMRFAKKMSAMATEDIVAMPVHRQWLGTWGLTIAAGCVPGIVLLLVPPILVTITGLAFIPFMYMWIRRRLLDERGVIALAADSCAEERIRVRIDPSCAANPPALLDSDRLTEPLPIHEEPVHEAPPMAMRAAVLPHFR